MRPETTHPVWDIFCKVVDNFGDIGVSWRLARQLAAEHDIRVRLWVDNLRSFQHLCPPVDPGASAQRIAGVEIRTWTPDFPEIAPGQVVIEAFGCPIPESFVATMARTLPRPVWINLEYLSAERWVEGCHTLSSPHPRLPLTKYFFFPGFNERTGGLLRETDLIARRQAFDAGPQRQRWWAQTGLPPPSSDALRISLFAYENPALGALLAAWENSATPICCLVPVSRVLPTIAQNCSRSLTAGDRVQRGALEIRVLPFVPQADYDALLWACDLNFVRGEDSFVRAQWAARPMLWHIYPQQQDAHVAKLDAFLDIYCAGLPADSADTVRRFWHAWNAGAVKPGEWDDFAAQLPQLRQHAASWAATLARQEDLSSSLVRFVQSRV